MPSQVYHTTNVDGVHHTLVVVDQAKLRAREKKQARDETIIMLLYALALLAIVVGVLWGALELTLKLSITH